MVKVPIPEGNYVTTYKRVDKFERRGVGSFMGMDEAKGENVDIERGRAGQAETREEPLFETCGDVWDIMMIFVEVNFYGI